MKSILKYLIVLAVLVPFTSSSFSQINVNCSGNVGIGTSSLPSGYKLRVAGGDALFSNGNNQLNICTNYDGNTPCIWSGNNSILFRNPWAGVWHNIGCNVCTQYSDVNGKKDIISISSGLDKVLKLRGVNYKLKSIDEISQPNMNLTGDSIAQQEEPNFSDDEIVIINSEPDNRTYAGFIAQEVEELIPEAVFTDETGLKMLSYSSFIPYIVEAMKEQQIQIEELKSQIEESKLKSTGDVTLNTTSILFQNIPNPFTENTEIKYSLSESVGSATIYIYDMQGKQIRNLPLYNLGESSITIHGSELQAGMYLYTLIADGSEIDTKRMILTD